jgi:AcrR family transcriptional regulator
MARKYELKRRAESQAETRQRIVEATVELHGTKGPGLTTFSDVARLAGVQRNTLYRHFPDERSLFMACTGHFGQLNPPPEPATWRVEPDPNKRLRRGLSDLYDFYERVEEMFTRVVRDAEFHELTREFSRERTGRLLAAAGGVLGEGLPRGRRTRAMLDMALDFRTWKRLARTEGLSQTQAVEAMVRAILAQ